MNLDSCLLSLSVLADDWWLAYHNFSSTPHAAAPDQRPIGESLISADRHDAYLLPTSGSHRGRVGLAALDGGVRGAANCHPEQ